MSKNKKCGNLSVLLFSILAAQVGYANSGSNDYSVVRIQDAQLAKVTTEGLRVCDLGKKSDGKNSYKVTFSKKTNCFSPAVNLLDSTGIISDLNLQTSTSKNVGRFVSWNIGSVVDKSDSSPTSYSVVFNKLSDSSCKSMEGSMPEVQVGLVDAGQDGSKKLTIRNISSQSIEITSIKKLVQKSKSPDAINTEFNGASISSITADQGVFIAPGDACDIVLKPSSICTSDEQEGIYKLGMEYKINGEISTSKFEVEIKYSCDWKQEKGDVAAETAKKKAVDEAIEKTKGESETAQKAAVDKAIQDANAAAETAKKKAVDEAIEKTKGESETAQKAAIDKAIQDANAAAETAKKKAVDEAIEKTKGESETAQKAAVDKAIQDANTAAETAKKKAVDEAIEKNQR